MAIPSLVQGHRSSRYLVILSLPARLRLPHKDKHKSFVNDFANKASQTWPVRMAQSAYTAAMAPGDYMQGKISDEEAQQQAFNLAGAMSRRAIIRSGARARRGGGLLRIGAD